MYLALVRHVEKFPAERDQQDLGDQNTGGKHAEKEHKDGADCPKITGTSSPSINVIKSLMSDELYIFGGYLHAHGKETFQFYQQAFYL